MATKQTAPTGLAKAGKSLWADITGAYELRADERRILEDACRERDLIARLDDELGTASVMVSGSMGQQIVNPIIAEIRQHRAGFASLMKQLKLPDESGSDQGGELSAKNRAAAQARWSHRGA